MRPLFSLFVGLAFGIGLCLSGMTMPSKVVGFLDLSGAWDPSLAFVMGGAIAVGLVLFRAARPRLAPPSTRVDRSLATGSILFGIGWGLVGYCPGPALAAISSLEPKALAFVAAMLLGTVLHRLVAALRDGVAAFGRRGDTTAEACA